MDELCSIADFLESSYCEPRDISIPVNEDTPSRPGIYCVIA
ncbi:hypothetical a-type peptide pheromone precursor, partial [Postia placenta Mad-698-R]